MNSGRQSKEKSGQGIPSGNLIFKNTCLFENILHLFLKVYIHVLCINALLNHDQCFIAILAILIPWRLDK